MIEEMTKMLGLTSTQRQADEAALYSRCQEFRERAARMLDLSVGNAMRRNREILMAATSRVPEPMQTKISFNPDELVNIFRSIVRQAIGEDADLGLLKSMMPAEVAATRAGANSRIIDIVPIVERIKWRVKMAKRFGLTLEVFRDERIDANSKADDIAILRAFSYVPDGEVVGRLDGIQHCVAEGPEAAKETKSIVESFILTRPSDYGCSEQDFARILEKLNVRRTERQIRRWEEYIRTCGKKGSQPPSGYSLQTRLTVASATAWAQSYANLEKAKLTTKTYLNEGTATLDKRPARLK